MSSESGTRFGGLPSAATSRASRLTRRDFLAAAGASATIASLPVTKAIGGSATVSPLIDVNVNLGRWPLRRVPADEAAALVRKLRAAEVTEAWAGSFD